MSILVIVILGNADPAMYNPRAEHAIQRVLELKAKGKDVFLLAKTYNPNKPHGNPWDTAKFRQALGPHSDCLLSVEQPGCDKYLLSKFSFDTIEEGAMARLALQECFPDPGQVIYLSAVTSEVHAPRSEYIFRGIFRNTKRFMPSGRLGYDYLDPCPTSDTERAENRPCKELNYLLSLVWETKAESFFVEWYLKRQYRSSLVNVHGGAAAAPFLQRCDLPTAS